MSKLRKAGGTSKLALTSKYFDGKYDFHGTTSNNCMLPNNLENNFDSSNNLSNSPQTP